MIGVEVPLSDAARQLGVSAETLRWQIHNGKLAARKVGPIWLVAQDEVDRYRRESLRVVDDDGESSR